MEILADRYRIGSILGAGGMGQVFLAEDTKLQRQVAIKLLPAESETDRVARERLRREALAAAALDHPFICKIHEIGEADGRLFIVMEYVEGETLQAHARRALLPMRDVIDLAHELAQALDTAHRRNIIHRDLKPANVMVTPQRHVKVMDFGLAKQVARFLSRTITAVCRLYLGAVGEAIEELGAIITEVRPDNFFHGLPHGNLVAGLALAGDCDRARSLIPTVVPLLPVAGRLNVHGAFFALDALTTGLAVLGEREHCRTLYPLALEYIRTGQVYSFLIVGPGTAHLTAALAADAAGLTDRSREHFEVALRQARELPMRVQQPMILYWYGRALTDAPDGAERSRGRALIEAALADFATLAMPLHVKLAEATLRTIAG